MENNIETVTVEVSSNLKSAILLLARDYKKGTASDLAENLLEQVVKGRLKAKRESAAEKTGEMWERMHKSLSEELRELLPTKQEFIAKELQKLDDVLYYLGR